MRTLPLVHVAALCGAGSVGLSNNVNINATIQITRDILFTATASHRFFFHFRSHFSTFFST
jgi:hypothetical protein